MTLKLLLLEQNIGLHDIGFDSDFLSMTPKARETQGKKPDKWSS